MNERLGIIVPVKPQVSLEEAMAPFGLKRVELNCWQAELYTPELADDLKSQAERLGIQITALWAGWPGPKAWDFRTGPDTLGLVPLKYRPERVEALKKGVDFAHWLGLPAIITHLGYIPEVGSSAEFRGVVGVVREVAEYLAQYHMEFWFETGQETPVTMLRLIHEVGTGNLGINLDPANLILYGKANPVDALDTFGAHVRSVHAKDGLYPTTPYELGKEVKVGAGKVNFPALLARLKELHYTGSLIIEREISGSQQILDIRDTITYLAGLLPQ